MTPSSPVASEHRIRDIDPERGVIAQAPVEPEHRLAIPVVEPEIRTEPESETPLLIREAMEAAVLVTDDLVTTPAPVEAAAIVPMIVQETPPNEEAPNQIEKIPDDEPLPLQPVVVPKQVITIAPEAVVTDVEEPIVGWTQDDAAEAPEASEAILPAAETVLETAPPAPDIISVTHEDDDASESNVELVATEPLPMDVEVAEPLHVGAAETQEIPPENLWDKVAAIEVLEETPEVSEEDRETFTLLVATAAQDETAAPLIEDERETLFENEPVILVKVPLPGGDIDPSSGFAEAVALPDEEAPDLETIIAEADELPLERTLARLEYILATNEVAGEAEAPSEVEAAVVTVSTEVRQTIHEMAALIREEGRAPEDEYISVRITPELTEKLVLVLRTIGYSDPRAALLDMIERQGIASVMQALIRLHQLCNDESRYEVRHKLRAPIAGFVAPVVSWLGRATMVRMPGLRVWRPQLS